MTSKKENQHIQVFVRVRPLNKQERDQRSYSVIEASNKEITVKQNAQDRLSKKFTFDKVFGPQSKQIDIYKSVVNPYIEEVLAGYNCTVFAYGQTGTGKTYTMAGGSRENSNLTWQNDPEAGIIPRSLSQLFDELRLLQVEYTVRVSYLELYNEELIDLLSPNDDSSKIRLYEDNTKKGSVIVHGLEEVTVHNKNEVYRILEKGSEKRQTASTLMNAQSSRSHTVFSITVHIKENSVDGEELLKTGKLNLVDLAGSENIGRSGAQDKRAREAGNINQSLLTLGRVITALVERTPHIPYRESKLTRLLQESLGGRTKTSIVATISPAFSNMDETLSTLEYAFRARNITNRPEINQRFTKTALLKQYTEEIERLRRDLGASRSCNGVYLAPENYEKMISENEYHVQELTEKISEIKALKEEMDKTKDLCEDLNMNLLEKTRLLEDTNDKLSMTTENLKKTNVKLRQTKKICKEKEHLIQVRTQTEQKLSEQAKTLLGVAEMSSRDVYKLHDNLTKRRHIDQSNMSKNNVFQNEFNSKLHKINHTVQEFTDLQLDLKNNLIKSTNTYSQEHYNKLEHIKSSVNSFLKKMKDVELEKEKNLKNQSVLNDNNSEENSEKIKEVLNYSLNQYSDFITKFVLTSIEKLQSDIVCLKDKQQRIIDYTNTKFNDTYLHDKNFSNRILELSKELADFTTNYCQISNTHKIANEQRNKRRKENREKLFAQFVAFLDSENSEEDKSKQEEHVMNTELQNLSENVSTNVNKIAESTKKFENKSEEMKVTYSEECSTMLTQTIQDCNALMNEQTTLETDSLQQIEKTKISTNKNITDIHDKFTSKQIDTSKQIEKFLQLVDDTKTDIDSFKKAHFPDLLQVQYSCDELMKRSVSCINNSVQIDSEFNDDVIKNIADRIDEVNKHFEEEIVQYVPTGQTPAKKEFQYPRYLAATSPHSRILERYRAATVEESDSDEFEYFQENDDNNRNKENILKSASVNDLLTAVNKNSLKNATDNKAFHRSSSDAKIIREAQLPVKETMILREPNI